MPSCRKELLMIGSIARLRKKVKGGYIMRVYFCRIIFFEFMIHDSDFMNVLEPIQESDSVKEVFKEFDCNMKIKRNMSA